MKNYFSREKISFLILFFLILWLNTGNATAYTFQKVISGMKGADQGQFGIILNEMGDYIGPNQIKADDKGNIYLCDVRQANNRIAKYDKIGNLIQVIGGKDIFPHGADNPRDITFAADGKYLVLEARQAMIYVFDGKGQFVSKHQTDAVDPFKILSDKSNRLYLEDLRKDHIRVYDKNFNPIATVGGKNTKIGEIDCFALTAGGHLVVGFTADDWHLKSYSVDDTGQVMLTKEVFLNNVYGEKALGFQLLRADDYGHIYVRFFDKDTGETIIQRYNSSGNVIEEYKLPRGPWPETVDSKGDIYFGQCDENEFRVMKVVK